MSRAARRRHRGTAVPSRDQSRPRVWFPREREAAEALNASEECWEIWYGVASRRFFAVSLRWGPLILRSPSATDLVRQMRDAEAESLVP